MYIANLNQPIFQVGGIKIDSKLESIRGAMAFKYCFNIIHSNPLKSQLQCLIGELLSEA